MKIEIKKTRPAAIIPQYMTTGAALPKAPRRKRGFIPSLSLNP